MLNHLVETEAIGPADVEADPDSMREAALADPEDRVDLAVEADAAVALAAEAGKAADPVAGSAAAPSADDDVGRRGSWLAPVDRSGLTVLNFLVIFGVCLG